MSHKLSQCQRAHDRQAVKSTPAQSDLDVMTQKVKQLYLLHGRCHARQSETLSILMHIPVPTSVLLIAFLYTKPIKCDRKIKLFPQQTFSHRWSSPIRKSCSVAVEAAVGRFNHIFLCQSHAALLYNVFVATTPADVALNRHISQQRVIAAAATASVRPNMSRSNKFHPTQLGIKSTWRQHEHNWYLCFFLLPFWG